jgi:hypothetical protein
MMTLPTPLSSTISVASTQNTEAYLRFVSPGYDLKTAPRRTVISPLYTAHRAPEIVCSYARASDVAAE